MTLPQLPASFDVNQYQNTVHPTQLIFTADQFASPEDHEQAETLARNQIKLNLAKVHGVEVVHAEADVVRFTYVKKIKNFMEKIQSGKHKIL
jgi:hypothetical protein